MAITDKRTKMIIIAVAVVAVIGVYLMVAKKKNIFPFGFSWVKNIRSTPSWKPKFSSTPSWKPERSGSLFKRGSLPSMYGMRRTFSDYKRATERAAENCRAKAKQSAADTVQVISSEPDNLPNGGTYMPKATPPIPDQCKSQYLSAHFMDEYINSYRRLAKDQKKECDELQAKYDAREIYEEQTCKFNNYFGGFEGHRR